MDREDIVTHLPTARLMQATKFMGNCTDCNYRKRHMHLFSSLSFTKTQNDCFILQQSWLKPGGQLLITDYCCSRGEHSEQFKKYLAERQYHLIDVESYGKVSVFRFSVAKVWFLVSKRTDEQNSRELQWMRTSYICFNPFTAGTGDVK